MEIKLFWSNYARDLINRRINRLNIKIKDTSKNTNPSKEEEDEYIIIAIDSSGTKITNRGENG